MASIIEHADIHRACKEAVADLHNDIKRLQNDMQQLYQRAQVLDDVRNRIQKLDDMHRMLEQLTRDSQEIKQYNKQIDSQIGQ